MRACPHPAIRASHTKCAGSGSLLRPAVLACALLFAALTPLAAETVMPHEASKAERAALFKQGVAAYDAEDYTKAYDIWLPLAQHGDLAAQRNVAHLLRRGLGTEKNPARALYFYERAAEGGMPAAALNAAVMYLGEDGYPRDAEAAAPFLLMAVQAGYPQAMFELGLLHQTGEGVEKDKTRAGRLFRLAAALGHAGARAKVNFESRLDEIRKPGRKTGPGL